VDLQYAYNFYNERLFDGKLDPALMTLQRQKGMLGYICFDRFSEKNGQKYYHELAMNSDYFAYRTTIETLSTVVHEMVHLQLHSSGNQKRKAYHCQEFRRLMEKVGLITSQTGRKGGKSVGQQMDHYIAKNGLFLEVSIELLDMGFDLPIYERFTPSYIHPRQFYQNALYFISEYEDCLEPKYLRPNFLNEFMLNKAKQEEEIGRTISELIRKKEVSISEDADQVVAELSDETFDLSNADELSHPIDTSKLSRDEFQISSDEAKTTATFIELKVETIEEITTPIKELLSIEEEIIVEPVRPVSRNKCKYQCVCEPKNNIWGKPNLNVMCCDCKTVFCLVE